MIRFIQLFAGLSAAFGVLCSAWLSHAGKTLPVASQNNIETAILFLFIHVIAIFLTVIMYHQRPHKLLLVSGSLFAFGIVTFSGLLIFKAFIDIGMLAKLTPMGGMSFVFAWLGLGIIPVRNTVLKGKENL